MAPTEYVYLNLRVYSIRFNVIIPFIFAYRKSSNKPPGGLLNFCEFALGAY